MTPLERKEMRRALARGRPVLNAPMPARAIVGPVPPKTNHFFHTGDLGDIVASLPIIRQLGGGNFAIGDIPMQTGHGRRQSMKGERYEAIKPLLEAQPYIHRVTWEEQPRLITHDLSRFRYSPHFHGSTITEWMARYLKVSPPDMSPWLTVEPNRASLGRVVFARSQRYHAPGFPWMAIADHLGDRAIFVGLPIEHEEFEREIGDKVEYAPTASLLEAAQLIASADMVVVNQTSIFWIALGLGVAIIQENFPSIPNSIVRRDNCRYPMNGFDYAELIKSIKAIPA